METPVQINERAQKLLKILVECYIREGQPVGSKTLAEGGELTMSSATIRNIMMDLETAGFINSPHTSAGRVPTVRGYRFFVDSLINTQALTEYDKTSPAAQLPQCTNTKELISAASSLLSTMTQLTGLVMLPRRESIVLRHVEFLPLSGNRVLVILVLNQYEVQNRVIYTDRCYTARELQQAGNFLTSWFNNKDLQQIRQELLMELNRERGNIEQLTQTIMDMTSKALGEQETNDYIVAGEANIFNFADYSGLGKLRELFEAFAQKRDILHLLNQCLHADGIKIYIGEESGYEPLGDCSMVTAPYRKNNKVVGVLGVIGPTRMPYEQTIAAVDVTAKLLSTALMYTE
ncbi:Heat-inducible transcription repressor HrcA [Gammaproteobacteria bacterium]